MADHSADAHGHDESEAVHPHIAPWQFYFKVFGALICLTGLTVGIANINLGHANLAIAIIIATIKASLVVTFFMHLKDDRRFNALLFLGALLFGGIFMAYTLNDTAYRGNVDGVSGMRRDYRTGEWANGTAEGKKQGPIIVPDLPAGAEHHGE